MADGKKQRDLFTRISCVLFGPDLKGQLVLLKVFLEKWSNLLNDI